PFMLVNTPCDLPQIENGNLAQYYYSFKRYYFPMHKGKKLSYSCMVGYTTETGTQDGRITCTAKGWSPVPQCYSELTLFISSLLPKLQYKCNPGYHTLSGGTEDTVQCQPQGWSFQPSCTKKLGRILMSFSLKTDLFYEIQCEGGKWTSPSVCIGESNCLFLYLVSEVQQDCASPPVIKNGGVLGPLLASYKNGSSVEYGCQRYHFLDGPSTVYCDHGNWTEQPTCLEPCTLNVTDMDSNNITLKWRREELIFLHGDLIEFECKQGYDFLQIAIPSPGRTRCDHGRLKYPKCVIQGKTIIFSLPF
uniref:Uncharacterized protein n=1 Tax=Corvus moneduloides TaxID=1196302 RepID=A0A8U7N5J5_CORMO